MRRIATMMTWELRQGLASRFLRVFALACLAGGAALLAAAPGREVLPMILIQAILFFGSLFAMLIGWSSGQQTREQGAFFFALPMTASHRIAGQLAGASLWCIALLLLFMGPAAIRTGMPATLLTLACLSIGVILVCVVAGVLLGMIATPTSGLLAVLLTWAIAVAGWELALLLLSDFAWVRQTPALFITLLLLNPLGAFRLAALIGLDAVPFDAGELQTGRWIFQNIEIVAAAVFALWISVLFAIGSRIVDRQEF